MGFERVGFVSGVVFLAVSHGVCVCDEGAAGPPREDCTERGPHHVVPSTCRG